jgi:RsmE family RNA methyltransferase
LIIGLPRPQTARDILRDATTLGVEALHFVRTEKGEPNYRQSTLWSSGEWRRHVLAGAEQAFDTHIPVVTQGQTLEAAIAESTGKQADATVRIALDNYEASGPLSAVPVADGSRVVLAIGSERGWSAAERDLLRAKSFSVAHLGTRVLRAETAVISVLTLVRGKLGLV